MSDITYTEQFLEVCSGKKALPSFNKLSRALAKKRPRLIESPLVQHSLYARTQTIDLYQFDHETIGAMKTG